MKVLLLSRYGSQGASSRVRYLQYLPYLSERGVQVDVVPLLSNSYLDALYAGSRAWREVLRGYGGRIRALLGAKRYDLVVVEKELFPFVPAIVEHLLGKLRVPYLADYDDALFHRYDLHRLGWVRTLLGEKIDKVMRQAAVVVAGNRYLADRAISAGAREVKLIPTVVDTQRYRPASGHRSEGMFTIGWIGTPKTSRYLKPLLPVFERLQHRHDVRFVAVGADRSEFRGTPVKAEPWSEETEVTSIQRFDIGIMPLEDSPWERGKCGYKLIQYMACGLPVVASPVGVNGEIVKDGNNGFLAESGQDWEQALERLIAVDHECRAAMGDASRMKIEEWYSLAAQAPRFLSAMRKAAS